MIGVLGKTARNRALCGVLAFSFGLATAAAQNEHPIRVGGNVQQANRISSVTPAYPPEAKQQGIQGTVRLEIVIGKDGNVSQITAISGPPELIKAAVDAVRQWVYKPTLLNGAPVEVITNVDVNFTLAQ